MKQAFLELNNALNNGLQAGEVLLCNFGGERSDFIRFNHGKVRQAGTVEQRSLSLRLVQHQRQAGATVTLTGTGGDLALARGALARLRDVLSQLPEDPWLQYAGSPECTASERRAALEPPESVVDSVVRAAGEHDLVGFYAGGALFRGFANSLGQQNWHEIDSFNLDWSVYRERDKAVKSRYAGFEWDAQAFETKMDSAVRQFGHLGTPARTLEPGEYRAYLAPAALEELTGLLSWGAFSARARETAQSPLLRMEHGETLSPRVTFTEATGEGVGPAFQPEGYIKPPAVTLISAGRLSDALISPRSAREYSLQTNGANARESPEAFDMAAGGLPQSEVLTTLDTGLYISNLWYLNFSDRAAGRVTGMTRFATFWVEHGRIVAPVNVMRFDDSIYRMLGENLIDLTQERDLLLDTSTYDERSTGSSRLPGALLKSLRFTL